MGYVVLLSIHVMKSSIGLFPVYIVLNLVAPCIYAAEDTGNTAAENAYLQKRASAQAALIVGDLPAAVAAASESGIRMVDVALALAYWTKTLPAKTTLEEHRKAAEVVTSVFITAAGEGTVTERAHAAVHASDWTGRFLHDRKMATQWLQLAAEIAPRDARVMAALSRMEKEEQRERDRAADTELLRRMLAQQPAPVSPVKIVPDLVPASAPRNR